MRVSSNLGLYGIGVYRHARVRPTNSHPSQSASAESTRQIEASDRQQQLRQTLSQVFQLRQTLTALELQQTAVTRAHSIGPAATASSTLTLDQRGTPTVLQSNEEVNATSTSFSQFGPALGGSTATVTVGGAYDGSSGSGTLKFLATRGGTHGINDLRFNVYQSDGQYLQTLKINADEPIDQTYTLNNGLTLNLAAGHLLKGDSFSVEVEVPASTTLSPTQRPYTGSTAEATVGGTYDGSSGSGTLTFVATRGGTHGTHDLRIQVIKPNGRVLQNLDIRADDPLNQTYTLKNGLTVTLGEGELLKRDRFAVQVDASESTAMLPTVQSYHGSAATAAVGGAYDGSSGSGTLTFLATRGGTHGGNDLRFNVYNPDGRYLQKIKINADDPIDQTYTLNNGLTLNLAAGNLLKGDSFSVEVEAPASATLSPSQPTYSGSTAEVTVGGTYDGSSGSGSLTFLTTRGGTHGRDELRIRVFNPNGNLLQNLDITADDPLDQPYTLNNGLTVTLGDGELLRRDTFSVQVSDGVGSAVDPNKPFNGTRNDNPNFQSTLGVTAGSFQLNGVTIEVQATDSITTVLDRISQSDAGVTARFDRATETARLTQKTPGSAHGITLSDDTSGFLSAVKLSGAPSRPGRDSEIDQALTDTARFSAVKNGSIRVNNVDLAVDVNIDSLSDLLTRLSDSEAGVSASFSEATQQVSLTATDPQAALHLDDNGTGLFDALGIEVGTLTPLPATESNLPELSEPEADAIRDQLKDMVKALRTLAADRPIAPASDSLRTQVRDDIQQTVSETLGIHKLQLQTELAGLSAILLEGLGPSHFIPSTQEQLVSNRMGPDGATPPRQLLFGKGGSKPEGILERVVGILNRSESDLTQQVGSTGVFINLLT